MMDVLGAFHFLRPWWLLLLMPALALWWFERRTSDAVTRWGRVIAPDLLERLILPEERKRWVRPPDLLLAGWVVAILAVAGPTWRQEPSPFAETGAPAMVLLKVSPSMMATDLAPTRLDRARQKLADFLAAREGAPTGLIAYSGSAHLVLPPTPDKDVVLAMAGALSTDIMPREGDRLADALKLADRVLGGDGGSGSIVVLADTVAGGQQATMSGQTRLPVTLLAMAPAEKAEADPALAAAVSAMGGDLVLLSLDPQDVTGIARSVSTASAVSPGDDEGQRWEEAGFWLTPVLLLLLLGWFRRGWVLS